MTIRRRRRAGSSAGPGSQQPAGAGAALQKDDGALPSFLFRSPDSSQLRTWPIGAFLGILAALLYIRSLWSDFVYDGIIQVLSSPYIHEPGRLFDVLTLRVMTQNVEDGNRPFHILTMMVNSLAWGTDPMGYHLTNILLHAATTALLFVFIVRLLDRPDVSRRTLLASATIGALVFAFHPLNCETVAEVSYGGTAQSALFVLTALLAATRFPGDRPRRTLLVGAVIVLACFLAVGTKESGAAGVPLLLLSFWLFRRKEPTRPMAILLVVVAVTSGALLAGQVLLPPGGAKAPYVGGSFGAMLLIQPRIWALQLLHVVWPTGLCADYGPYSLRNITLFVAWLVVGSCGVAAIVFSRRNPVVALGVAIVVLGILPVSNFVPLFKPIADRFMYLPMAGIALILAQALARDVLWDKPWKVAAHAVLWFSVLAGLGGATYQRQAVWRDSLSLWRDTAQRNPYSYLGAHGLGIALLNDDRPADAIASFLRALDLTEQRDQNSWIRLAVCYEIVGDRANADRAFQRAVALEPRLATPRAVLSAPARGKEGRYLELLDVIAQRNRGIL